MKFAGDLVGVKPLPSFTAAWREDTKRTVTASVQVSGLACAHDWQFFHFFVVFV